MVAHIVTHEKIVEFLMQESAQGNQTFAHVRNPRVQVISGRAFVMVDVRRELVPTPAEVLALADQIKHSIKSAFLDDAYIAEICHHNFLVLPYADVLPKVRQLHQRTRAA